ncbi:hypothetical protein FUAX_29920 [Fulvitalea axinellae]|uniref:Uncharacterized protein n=1 Tax=Fulvitalea axinellae TaxID=1182444 RepID=A0AAU9DDL6_9BACT|nr:hypothetical protein FUAX_29920 [Fulvitalea axinellae]
MNKKMDISNPIRTLAIALVMWLAFAGTWTEAYPTGQANMSVVEKTSAQDSDEEANERNERLPVSEQCYLTVAQTPVPVAQFTGIDPGITVFSFVPEIVLPSTKYVRGWIKFAGGFLEVLLETIISTNAP